MPKSFIIIVLFISFQVTNAFEIKVNFDTTAVRDTITFEQFGAILYTYKGGSITIQNAIIIEGNFDYTKNDTINNPTNNLNLDLRFENVWFKDEYVLYAKVKSITANGSNLNIIPFQSTNQFDVENCILIGLLFSAADVEKTSYISIRNSEIYNSYKIALGIDGAEINGSNQSSLILNKVHFTSDNDSNWVQIGSKIPSLMDIYNGSGSKKFNEIIIDSCIFDLDVSFEQAIIGKEIMITNTTFNHRIGFNKTVFPNAFNVNIKWDQIKESLGIINRNWVMKRNDYGELMGFKALDKFSYGSLDDELIKNQNNYDQLVAVYNEFIHIYKDRGDLNSKNECYKELKDLETKRLKYLYQTELSSKNFLNWQLNVFLKFFAEYGTSPIRSLIVSFWVVLMFAVVYFFTSTSWDNINRKSLIKQSKKMMGYFRSEQSLDDFYSDNYKEEILEYEDFKKEIKESANEVPFFFMFLLKPLYYLSVIKHKMNSWLYRRVEILSGRWIDLTKGRKIIIGSTVACATLGYLVYLFVVRSLNSIILSINTFSTLGFGDIPVKGVMRYVAVLEGFLGWFLLSIFSVSLISQILQS